MLRGLIAVSRHPGRGRSGSAGVGPVDEAADGVPFRIPGPATHDLEEVAAHTVFFATSPSATTSWARSRRSTRTAGLPAPDVAETQAPPAGPAVVHTAVG